MLYYIILDYIISYYIVLYYIVLYYIVLYYIILHYYIYILESQAGSPHAYPKWLVESFGQNVQREILYKSK